MYKIHLSYTSHLLHISIFTLVFLNSNFHLNSKYLSTKRSDESLRSFSARTLSLARSRSVSFCLSVSVMMLPRTQIQQPTNHLIIFSNQQRDQRHQPAVPRKDSAAPPTTGHGGATDPPDRAAIQRRRLRAPVWARSLSWANAPIFTYNQNNSTAIHKQYAWLSVPCSYVYSCVLSSLFFFYLSKYIILLVLISCVDNVCCL